MEIIKTFSDETYAVKCGFCEGTGTEPVPDNMEETDVEDWTCTVCDGKGLIVESGAFELLATCARCSGEGKINSGGYYFGVMCTVCEGKGYIRIKDSLHQNIWPLLHPRIRTDSRKSIQTKNYDETLMSCIKNLNIELKAFYKMQTGKESDGAALVGALFSIDKPLLRVADLSSESGRNRQKGLIQIMQGFFVGIRNPVLHDLKIY